jgi:hypothetical protein
MSETHDKRRRTDLDAFVLALIESGISTPYELQKMAGLSPGATIPALERLVGSGFARQGKPGVRGRTDHKTTAAGRKFLTNAWRTLIDDGPSGDLDADLRVALLALYIGGERQLAVDFLRRSAARQLESAALEESNSQESLAPIAIWYRRLRASATVAQLKNESVAALTMADALPRSLSGKVSPRKRRARSQK